MREVITMTPFVRLLAALLRRLGLALDGVLIVVALAELGG
jgi:hypothetical protein